MPWFYVIGTPIVNTIQDLAAQLRFVRLQPFFVDPSLFSRFLGRPVKAGKAEAVGQLRTMIQRVAIRRDKKLIVQLELPPKVCYLSGLENLNI